MYEIYFGCECSDLNHIARFSYFPPEKGEKIDEEDNVIYFTVKTENYLNRIIPPFSWNPFDWPYDTSQYVRFHILRRLPIALCFIFNPHYVKKYGILDCFDFQNKDLPAMKTFLSYLTNEEGVDKKVIPHDGIWLNNGKWRLRLYVQRIFENFPYSLGWEIQFIPRNIIGRIKLALKYFFGFHCDEQEFNIDEENAKRIKSLINAVGSLNKNDSKNI